MSTRHRNDVPKPAPSERRIEHHRERQAMRLALAASADPEELIDPRTRHTLHPEHTGTEHDNSSRRRFRHWKARFWKRRSAMRHRRNQDRDALAIS